MTIPTTGAVRAPSTSDAERRSVRQRRWIPRGRAAEWLFLAPAIIYLGLFFGYPIVKNLTMSLQDYTMTTFVTGAADFVGLENYRYVFSSRLFDTALRNTLVFTVASLSATFVIGLFLAVFLNRQFPLRTVYRSVLLIPWLLPLVSTGAVWRWMLDQDNGIINQALLSVGLISSPIPWLASPTYALASVIIVNIWIGIPFVTIIFYGGLQTIPNDLYEAASIDGANGVRTFRHITWPLLRPVISVILVLGVVYTVKVLDIILMLTGGGPASASETLATASYSLSFQQFHFGRGAAMGNVLILISLLFTAIYLYANRRSVES